MKLTEIAQVGFVIVAAIGVHQFVRMTINGEQRRVCSPLCAIRPNYAAQDRLAPDFELPSLDGTPVRLADYRGKVVVLNFWTKTCAPCLEELPSLAELGKSLAQHPRVTLLTITTDDTAADARTTLRSVLGEDVSLPVLIDRDAKVVTDRFGTRLYPETWFIDPDGVIRARVDGPRDWSEPIVLDFLETLHEPRACKLEFRRGIAHGPDLSLCAGLL